MRLYLQGLRSFQGLQLLQLDGRLCLWQVPPQVHRQKSVGSPREVADEEDSVEARGVSDLVLLWCSQNRMGRHQTAKVRPGSGRLDTIDLRNSTQS